MRVREPLKQRSHRRFIVKAAASLLSYIIVMALIYRWSGTSSHVCTPTPRWWNGWSNDTTCRADVDTPTKASRNPFVNLLNGATLSRFVPQRRPASNRNNPPPQRSSHSLEMDTADESPSDATTTVYFAEAYSVAPVITDDQWMTLYQLSRRVQTAIPDLHHRVKAVGWGGSHHASSVWWNIVLHSSPRHDETQPRRIDHVDGGIVLWHHYNVMRRHMAVGTMRDDSSAVLESGVYYPVKLCKAIDGGCAAEQSLQHTLEWREKYQPWRVSPAMRDENDNGWVYHRGFSPSPRVTTNHRPYGHHALVWIRPGQHSVRNGLAYFRCILNAIDRAVADALHASQGRVGKFNIVIDATDYEWAKMPDFAHTKQCIIMLQDHYPNRLGMILLVNLSRSAEFLFSLISPLVSKEVRDKIHMLSTDPERRAAELAALVQPEFLPDWLGGKDRRHNMDADFYYSKEHMSWTNEQSSEFLVSMDYHALS